ncbi:hypothetical protein DM02DRAFT_654856 [Periconia macrospinosa]|uniref:Uncharacterized protein n=1 Tax=Periconia macrospinosa TaxID=97972 RepID=A0A2V1DT70_9PLEO|nr:hypothetical protein DM02DRAFT_654856 [Periconia macrospinosa]
MTWTDQCRQFPVTESAGSQARSRSPTKRMIDLKVAEKTVSSKTVKSPADVPEDVRKLYKEIQGLARITRGNPMPAQVSGLSPPVTSTPSSVSIQSMQGNNSGTAVKRIASQSGDPASSQSGIPKYGTPSHLLLKPPAPAPIQQVGLKFTLPSTTRVPSNMSQH